ncbi:hypothetical protein PGB90_003643 [Kerria lacca]
MELQVISLTLHGLFMEPHHGRHGKSLFLTTLQHEVGQTPPDSDPNLPEFSRITIVIAGIPYEWYSYLESDKNTTKNNLITRINQIDRLCSHSFTPSSSSASVSRSSQNNSLNRNHLSPPISLTFWINGNQGIGFYDPGSNTTNMPLHVLSNFCNIQFLKKPSVFKTMSGDDQFLDVAIISLQVFSNTASIIVWIVNKPSFKYDTLIGLDTIKKFRLHQDEFLSISQVPFSPSPPVAVSPISDNLINWNEAIPVDKFEANIEHLSLDRRSQITSLIDKYSQIINNRSIQQAETVLLGGNVEETESILLQNGLIFRVIYLNSVYVSHWIRILDLVTKYKTHVDTVLMCR